MPSSSSTRMPPGRLAAWRRRAWSTRIRRITCEAMAKNCARLTHSVRSCPQEPQVGLVHERRGLQGVPAPLAPQAGGGPLAKLSVDQRDERLTRLLVPSAPGLEQLADRTGIGGLHRWQLERTAVPSIDGSHRRDDAVFPRLRVSQAGAVRALGGFAMSDGVIGVTAARKAASQLYVWLAVLCALIAFGGFARASWLDWRREPSSAPRSCTCTACCLRMAALPHPADRARRPWTIAASPCVGAARDIVGDGHGVRRPRRRQHRPCGPAGGRLRRPSPRLPLASTSMMALFAVFVAAAIASVTRAEAQPGPCCSRRSRRCRLRSRACSSS